MRMDLPHLAGFLAGYLHQDWNVEFVDSEQAALAFARDEGSNVPTTVEEIDELRASELSERDLAAWVLNAGCYYQPHNGGTFNAWLLQLRTILARVDR